MKRILGIAALLLVACGNDAPVAKIVEIDKKMPLLAWPDEHYIATVDSIIAAEKVIPDKDSGKTQLTLNAFKAPTLALPQKQGQKHTTTKGEKRHEAHAKEKVDNSAEVFMDKFSRALSALQSDPSNASLYKTVEAREGDDLFKLLRRTYGAGSQNLPRFYVLSALQSVNAGVSLEHLNAGDKVRVPRI
jgi:hypothetical protein